MKRKIFSVLFALVLLASFSLVMAVPAAADPDGVVLEAWGDGTAEWSTTPSGYNGNYCVKLTSPGGGHPGASNFWTNSSVMVPYGETLSTLATIGTQNIIFRLYFPTGSAVPFGLLYLDTTLDGAVDVLLSAKTKTVLHGGPTADGWRDGLMYNDEWSPVGYDEGTITTPVEVCGTSWEFQQGLEYDLSEWVAEGSCWENAIVKYVGFGYCCSSNPAYVDDIIIDSITYELEWTHVSPIQVDDDRVQYPDAPFQTIQGAIDCAIASDIINVAAGTYTEDVNVDVAGITLQAESLDAIVDGGFRTRVSDITIDGFTIMNGAAGPTSYFPACIAADDPAGQSGHSFTNNVIIGAGPDDPKTGIYLKNCTGTLIDGNEIYGGSSRAIAFITESHDTTITNNNIHDCMGGICPGESDDAIIRFNQVHDNTGEGMQLWKCDGLSINLNNIYNNVACGICYHTNTNLDATLNWWGDASGPLTNENTGGLGNSVICDSGTIASYSPWLGFTVGTSPMTFIVDDVGTEPAAGYIQAAIDAASSDDTVSVADGTYNTETFPIDVDVANLTIQSVSGAASTTIDSGDTSGRVIAISAAGVTIGGTGKGFKIEGEGAVADGLIYIGANDATITANQFVGDYYLMVLAPSVSGAMVEDNIFLADGTPANEVTGIYVNNDVTASTFDGNSFPLINRVDSGIYMAPGTTADQTITISNNTFAGMGLREHDSAQMGCAAIELDGVGGITIESNTIVNSNDGIYLRGVNALTGDVTIQYNTIIGNVWGIEVKDGVGTVGTITANYNAIVGNTTYGFENAETDITVDAKYNWWGNVAGPHIGTNPYDAHAGSINDVSNNVDYIPWLIHTELASGWNIYSTPIALDSSCDTIGDALDIWTADSGNFVIAYYFDSSASTPHWASATTATALTPLQAIYVKMSAAATIDVWNNSSYTAPPSQTMYVGWNLIGLAELYSKAAEDALASAYYVAGANNIGYSQIVSPGLGQTAWSAMRGSAIDTVSSQTMAPCEGYWMNMVNQGILAGFTSTPIAEQ